MRFGSRCQACNGGDVDEIMRACMTKVNIGDALCGAFLKTLTRTALEVSSERIVA